MRETLTFDFCEITIYDNYVVVVVKEGITLTPKHNKELLAIKNTFFNKKSFVYITHRVNSYSVDPQIYYDTSKIDTLKGFAVVTNNYKAKVNAQIEQRFFDKPFKIFTELEDAVAWVDEVLDND